MKTRAALRWHVFAESAQLTAAVVEAVRAQSEAAIGARGAFHVVLAGGTTPRHIYRQLAKLSMDWSRWHIYFGDERCLPDGAPDRNDTMAFDTWLSHVPVPLAQIRTLPADAQQDALDSYTRQLDDAGTFDLVLLGLGEDGHTASLFPGAEVAAYAGTADLLVIVDAPKAPARRVSMSANRLSNARSVFFLVSGAAKRGALRDLRDGADIPAACISSASGLVDVYADEDAQPTQSIVGLQQSDM